MKHYGDITKIKGNAVEPVDIIVGGSPCQDLSQAGLHKGLKHSELGDDEATRSGLFMEQIRIIKEMQDADRNMGRSDRYIRPRFMVWENVPGAFASNGGDDFRTVLEETARVADCNTTIPRLPHEQAWSDAGAVVGDRWSLAWRVHDAQFWGVPQRRKRISLVADFRGEAAPQILFERQSLSGNPAKREKQGQGIAENIKRSADAGSRYGFAMQAIGEYKLTECASSLKQRDYKDATDLIVECHSDGMAVRRYTPTECGRLQGYPDGWLDIGDWVDSKGKTHKDSDSLKYKAFGNSIALPFWEWMANRMANVLREDGSTEITMASLFDGIGGFPLVFQRAGVRPVWASEIEEFPIAVTKIRFPEDE